MKSRCPGLQRTDSTEATRRSDEASSSRRPPRGHDDAWREAESRIPFRTEWSRAPALRPPRSPGAGPDATGIPHWGSHQRRQTVGRLLLARRHRHRRNECQLVVTTLRGQEDPGGHKRGHRIRTLHPRPQRHNPKSRFLCWAHGRRTMYDIHTEFAKTSLTGLSSAFTTNIYAGYPSLGSTVKHGTGTWLMGLQRGLGHD